MMKCKTIAVSTEAEVSGMLTDEPQNYMEASAQRPWTRSAFCSILLAAIVICITILAIMGNPIILIYAHRNPPGVI
jgi:hypothetical protein